MKEDQGRGMTVAELIEELAAFDPDLPVYIGGATDA